MPRRRGDFYDRYGRNLTGAEKQWYALCVPGDSSYARLFPYVGYAEQAELYQQRNSTRTFLVPVDFDLTREGVYTYEGEQRYFDAPIAVHLIGSLDSEGHGVAGLEYAFDDVLYSSGDVQEIDCTTTAQGAMMTGTQPTLVQKQRGTGMGVCLTIDAVLQRACEGVAALTMERGCIAVMKTDTGELLASVSMPGYDPENIAPSIEANDTSLIDRPLAAFDAGSVFKVVLSVAAYDAGITWFEHECTGQIEVGEQVYRCAQGRAHGSMNLRGALQQSCNCYFIALGELLGKDRIMKAAKELGFGTAIALAPGLKSASGVLPEESTLESEGQRAMFSFGQGQLTVTPLQITAMMNTIACGGLYHMPTLVKSIVNQSDEEVISTPETAQPRRVCDAQTADILRDMLVSVVTEGIGEDAAPSEGGAGGKTGTAQTGQYDADGSELLNYWFSGFYPAQNPQYTITVLQDGMTRPEHSSAKIFSMVAAAISCCDK